jgi:hypothetical protein
MAIKTYEEMLKEKEAKDSDTEILDDGQKRSLGATKNPNKRGRLKELLKLKESDKVLGLTKEDKLQLMKDISKVFKAKNPEEFLAEYATELYALKLELTKAHETCQLGTTLKDRYMMLPLMFQYVDRVSKFGEMRFGLGKDKVAIQQNINLDMDKLKEAWNKANKKNAELKVLSVQERMISNQNGV